MIHVLPQWLKIRYTSNKYDSDIYSLDITQTLPSNMNTRKTKNK